MREGRMSNEERGNWKREGENADLRKEKCHWQMKINYGREGQKAEAKLREIDSININYRKVISR